MDLRCSHVGSTFTNDEVLVVIVAVIGTGSLGSVIAVHLASGGESLRLSSADSESAQKLANEIGPAAVVAADNHDALRGAQAIVLALRFPVLKGVIGEIADSIGDKLVIVPSNPVGVDGKGEVSRLLPKGESSGRILTGWLPVGARLVMAFGTLSAALFTSSSNRSPERAVLFYETNDDRASREVERLIRATGYEPVKVGGVELSDRLEVGGDLHDLVVGPAEASLAVGGV
jgi:8-hydroxy-5-deazaflavin:NADPH oxidoreductase